MSQESPSVHFIYYKGCKVLLDTPSLLLVKVFRDYLYFILMYESTVRSIFIVSTL